MTKKENTQIEVYSNLKKKQEKLLKKVFDYPEYSFEKCIAMGGLTVEKDKVMVKDKAGGCDEPPMYEFFRDYDFEKDE
ncbi:MAG: hypothetical protein ACTSR8_00430 [Promethearchaeota archaeon]